MDIFTKVLSDYVEHSYSFYFLIMLLNPFQTVLRNNRTQYCKICRLLTLTTSRLTGDRTVYTIYKICSRISTLGKVIFITLKRNLRAFNAFLHFKSQINQTGNQFFTLSYMKRMLTYCFIVHACPTMYGMYTSQSLTSASTPTASSRC